MSKPALSSFNAFGSHSHSPLSLPHSHHPNPHSHAHSHPHSHHSHSHHGRLAQHNAHSHRSLAHSLGSGNNNSINNSSNNCTLFLGDLFALCTEADIHDLFAPFGEIAEIKIMRSEETNRNLSYGFIKFLNILDATKALNAMNGVLFGGRHLRVGWASYKNKKEPKLTQHHDRMDSASIHVSYISFQLARLVTEESLRQMFSVFGVVIDTSIKKSFVDEATQRQCGYGFVHFASHPQGVQSALDAVRAVNDATLDEVDYKCSVSHSLEKLLAQPHAHTLSLSPHHSHGLSIPHARAAPSVLSLSAQALRERERERRGNMSFPPSLSHSFPPPPPQQRSFFPHTHAHSPLAHNAPNPLFPEHGERFTESWSLSHNALSQGQPLSLSQRNGYLSDLHNGSFAPSAPSLMETLREPLSGERSSLFAERERDNLFSLMENDVWGARERERERESVLSGSPSLSFSPPSRLLHTANAAAAPLSFGHFSALPNNSTHNPSLSLCEGETERERHSLGSTDSSFSARSLSFSTQLSSSAGLSGSLWDSLSLAQKERDSETWTVRESLSLCEKERESDLSALI